MSSKRGDSMNDENDATPIAGNVLGKDESVKEESPNTETDDDAGNHFNPIDQQVEVIVQPIDDGPRQITPGTISATKSARPGPGGGHGNNDQVPTTPVSSGFSNVKKRLFPTDSAVVAITPARKRVASKECIDDPNDEDDKHSSKRQRNPESPAKRRLIFGRTTTATEVTLSSKVRAVYKIINQRTGAIGGNGCFGPIYGELTAGSMQRIINLMKEHTQFNSKSRFIDVGSGIGKPNLHTAQDPGVEISYGIESEESRWLLGMNCLQGVFDAIDEQNNCDVAVPDEDKLSCSCVFVHGNILDVETFNPFTHVYMFSIGFPPSLWIHLADMWNKSLSPFLICYHGPRDIIECYEFNVELITQISTSMHGSKESHTGYIYRRSRAGSKVGSRTNVMQLEQNFDMPCDPYYKEALIKAKSGASSLKEEVFSKVNAVWDSSPSTRSGRGPRR